MKRKGLLDEGCKVKLDIIIIDVGLAGLGMVYTRQ